MSPLFALAAVSFLVATVMLVIAVVRVVRTLVVLSNGVAVLAVVHGDGSPDDPFRLRYNTLSGDPVMLDCPPGLKTVAEGDRLPMVYVPDRPGKEAVLDSRVLWYSTAVVALAGLMLAGAGSLALWWAPDPSQPIDKLQPEESAVISTLGEIHE